MKITPGFWKTDIGQRAEVVSTRNGLAIGWVNDSPHQWFTNGSSVTNRLFNLICPWVGGALKPRRFVKLFQPEFAWKVEIETKRRTIRKLGKFTPNPGDVIDCREWSGSPYRSPQIRLGEYLIKEVAHIAIIETGIAFLKSQSEEEIKRFRSSAMDPGFVIQPDAGVTSQVSLESFAKMDGFDTWDEMKTWFRNVHGLPFVGIMIGW